MNLILLCFVSCIVQSNADMLGPGIWSLISIGECPDELEREVVKIEINKHKLNRTHDGLSATLDISVLIDDSYGALVEVCKYVDGGCKQYQVLSDDSMVSMLNKYAKDNVVSALSLADIDPPEFPVEEGKYEVEDYVMDYCKLPRDAVYGKFEALTYLIMDNEKLACVKCVLEFNKFEEENYCDEE